MRAVQNPLSPTVDRILRPLEPEKIPLEFMYFISRWRGRVRENLTVRKDLTVLTVHETVDRFGLQSIATVCSSASSHWAGPELLASKAAPERAPQRACACCRR